MHFFLSQLPANEIEPKVEQAINYIHRQKGNVSISDIERTCFITSRSLERYFKTYIGLSPKDYAKIYRFKCLMNPALRGVHCARKMAIMIKRILPATLPVF